jgi:hypothetical protein
VNEVSKAFFWTPHVQMFSFFTAVASLALHQWMQPRLPTLMPRRMVVEPGSRLGGATEL